jgi:uncharacterized protein (TIGR03086 family)
MANAPIPVGEPPTIDIAFLRGVSVFNEVLTQVPEHAWDAASLCQGWTARDVVDHVVGTMTKGIAVLRGAPFQAGPSRLSNAASDPLVAWRAVMHPAREAVRTAELHREVDTPHGRRTIAEALAFPAADLAVHAWDVADATGQTLQLPRELLSHVVATCEQVPEHVLRGPDLFGPAQQAPADADNTTKLMAWLGRETTRTCS